jgi:hypothetical protein
MDRHAPVGPRDDRDVVRARDDRGGSSGTGPEYPDWCSTWHASREEGVLLTLGYNTALFCAVYRLRDLKNFINKDGVEWRR